MEIKKEKEGEKSIIGIKSEDRWPHMLFHH